MHIVNDVKKFGNVDLFSALEFENYIQSLKGLLHKHEKPLQQITRRYGEIVVSGKTRQPMLQESQFRSFQPDQTPVHYNGLLIDGQNNPQYSCVRNSDTLLYTSLAADNCCVLNN